MPIKKAKIYLVLKTMIAVRQQSNANSEENYNYENVHFENNIVYFKYVKIIMNEPH